MSTKSSYRATCRFTFRSDLPPGVLVVAITTDDGLVLAVRPDHMTEALADALNRIADLQTGPEGHWSMREEIN
ncbi:hypothetical protein [Streptomyces aidingensis]|uniref:Uncharacterized protein n=1 Tax=Streptomyces aidingensis TaxID=910347 RepID=A0A1I1Q3F8_9ACTN|nr:hypothetical protein [Streptomyces aidingensis]SFD12670.1 hypothetical protein SAMN05421773_11021 [Streptomyces aidingensis]